jgi:hypothetical protein
VSDRRRTLTLLCAVIVFSAISSSLAYWTTSGGGAATLSIGGLNPPPKPVVQITQGGTAVKVDWSPGSTLSDNVTPAQGYYVTRSDGVTTAAACGTSPMSLTTSTSCEDGPLAPSLYTYRVVAVWRSLSAESAPSEPISTDTTPPTNSLSLTGQSGGGSYLTGTTIYYRGTVAGSFAIQNTVADSGSGPASSAFPALGGTTTGWTHSGSTVTTPSGGPYLSGAFSWIAGTTTSPTETVTGADKAGNTAATTVTMKNDITAPTGSISYTNGYNVSGTVAVTFSASDEGSGVNAASGQLKRATATLSAGVCGIFSGFENLGSAGLASPYNDSSVVTNTCYKYEYVVADNVGNQGATGSASVVKVDKTAPSGGSLSVPAYSKETSVAVTFSAGSDAGSGINSASGQLKRATTTLSNGSCGSFGEFANVGAAGPTSPFTSSGLENGRCYEYQYVVADNAGNSTTYGPSAPVQVDTTSPTNSLSLTGQSGGGSYLTGTTIYYRGAVAGSFAIQNAVADSGSGTASSAFPALGGTTTGWTHSGSTVTTPSGGPYVSGAFSWTAGTTTSPTETVTGADKAGNGTSAALTLTNDTTAPSGGSVSVPAYSKELSVAVTFSAGSDTGSGINTTAAVLSRAEATYTPATDTCGSFGAFTSIATGPTSPFSNTVVSGKCFRYQYTVPDNVGNSATYESGTLKVNTTGPTVTAISSLDPAGAAAKGKLVNGATLTITFSEPLQPTSIAAGCPGSCTITGAKETRGATGNVFLVIPGITTSGGADTGSTAYLTGSGSATATFTASVAFSAGNTVLTITVSEVAGTPAESKGELKFTPAGSLTDLFGNAATGTFKTPSSFKLF